MCSSNTYLEKRSAIARLLPRAPTIDSSLAVTRRDWEAHCLLSNELTAIAASEAGRKKGKQSAITNKALHHMTKKNLLFLWLNVSI